MRFAPILLSSVLVLSVIGGPAYPTTEQTPAAADQSRKGDSPTSSQQSDESSPKPVADAATPAAPRIDPESAPAGLSLPASDPPAATLAQPPHTANAPADADAPATASAPGPADTPAHAAPAAAADVDVVTPRTELLKQIATIKAVSKAERTALTEFYEGRGEDLVWVADAAFTPRAQAVIAEINRAGDWGLEASAFEIPAAPASSEPAQVAETELKLALAVLKYASHARGGRMDPRQLSNYIDRDLPLIPPKDVLEAVASVEAADDYLRKLHPRHPQFEKLRQAYLALRDGAPLSEANEEPTSAARPGAKAKTQPAPVSKQATLRKLLVNMEQWRWMPEDLGAFHVWANVPEFMVRVMKDGQPVFTERLIAGKPDTQTPIFSDEMAFLVFHPFWGVPDSIKMKEVLPSLERGGTMLEKNNLRIQYRGRDIDPRSIDWTRTDIRNFHVYQPPGAGNVLGVVKFMFPNKHQVYMHDTPTKHLFNSAQRTFSHGCMRIRNPLRFAEVLLAHDKGWDGRRIASLVDGGPQNNTVNLATKIPVHITYFTAWVDDDGKLNTRPDVYGHEPRIQMGLEGRAHLIVKRKEELAPVRADAVSRLVETKSTWGGSSKTPDWARKIFGN